MMVKERVRLEDVRFEEVPYKCKCGHEGKEVIVVANDTGILDTQCPECGRRIVEFKILEPSVSKEPANA